MELNLYSQKITPASWLAVRTAFVIAALKSPSKDENNITIVLVMHDSIRQCINVISQV